MSIIQLCKELRPDAFSLADVIQLPNFMGNALGNEDLDIYNRVISFVKSGKGNVERAHWWKELH